MYYNKVNVYFAPL